MKALSIRQPWAWLIIRPDLVTPDARAIASEFGRIKDVENRDWPTKYRGRVLIHASKGCSRREWDDVIEFVVFNNGFDVNSFPRYEDIDRGGIIGSVEIVNCVSYSSSPWFMGKFGFMLRDPLPMPFIPLKGQLGLFDVPGVEA